MFQFANCKRLPEGKFRAVFLKIAKMVTQMPLLHLQRWEFAGYPSPQIHLVGGAITILKNMKVNGKDDIPYMKWKIKHVPNHQSVIFPSSSHYFPMTNLKNPSAASPSSSS